MNLLIEPENEPVMSFYEQRGYTTDQLLFMEKWISPPADQTSARQTR